jgi:methionyl-tRNA formyltransferase
MTVPSIALLCATRRGLACLQKVRTMLPFAKLTVVSFREEPHEPPFIDRIREYCNNNCCHFIESKNLLKHQIVEEWKTLPPDVLLAVNWRFMLQTEVYRLPRIGSYVFHDSLLPRYRGFSPTVWAIINGEKETGASLIEMNEEVDAGALIDQACIEIGLKNIGEVFDDVTQAYLKLIERNLLQILNGTAKAILQDESLASYCCKRLPTDNKINWDRSAIEIHNLIRATTRPYSGAFCFFENKMVRVWSSSVSQKRFYVGSIPGRLVDIQKGHGVTVLTKDGAIVLHEIELENEVPGNSSMFLNRLSITLS